MADIPEKIPVKTREELKQLAVDINAGKVFTNAHVPEGEKIEVVFLPIALGALSGWTPDQAKDIGLIYEYLSEATPMTVNGMPGFISMQLLNRGDTDRLWALMKKIEEALDSV